MPANISSDKLRKANRPHCINVEFFLAKSAQSTHGYWLTAGRRLLQRGANKEAIGHLSRGLEC